MSMVIDIADAVVELLNGEFAPNEDPGEGAPEDAGFEAVREYRPLVDLAELKDLRVTVIPKTVTTVAADRSRVQQDVEIDVLVQKKLAVGDAEELDGLMSVVESIAGFLKFKRLDSVGALWLKTANDPIYAPDHLEQLRQFTSVLTLTYRVVR